MKVYLKNVFPNRGEIKPAIKLPMEVNSPNSVPCTVVVNRHYPIAAAPFNYFCLSSDEFGFLPEMPVGSIDAMIEYTKCITASDLKLDAEYKNMYEACMGKADKEAEKIGLATDKAFYQASDMGHIIADLVCNLREAVHDIDYIPVVDVCRDAKEAKDIIHTIDRKKREYGEVVRKFCDDINTSFEELQEEMLKALEVRLKHPDRFVHLMTFSVEN